MISFDVFGWLLLTVSFIALIFVIDESSAFGLLSIPVLLAIVIFGKGYPLTKEKLEEQNRILAEKRGTVQAE